MIFFSSPYVKTAIGLLALKNMLGGPKNIRLQPLPSFIGVAEVRSFVPGRLRLYIPSLKRNLHGCGHLRENLARLQSIREYEVNPLLGTALIQYDPQAIDPRVLMGAVIKLLGLEQEAENPESRVTKEVGFFMKSLNSAVMEKTRGLLDLNSLVLLLFVGVGSYKALIRKTGGPAGITYLWWASSLIKR